MMKKTLTTLMLITGITSASTAVADSILEQNLQAVLNGFITDNPTIPGVMVTLDSEKLNALAGCCGHRQPGNG